MKNNLIWIAVILFTFTVNAYPSENNIAKKSELTTINKNIASIQTELKQATLKKSQLQSALEQTENTESTINNELKTTQKTLSAQQEKLKALQKQTIPLSKEKNKNREALKQQIRAAYLFSQKPYLKLLLEPNNVAKTQHMLMYFHYITNEQTKTMTKLEKSLTSCMRNQKAIQKQYAKLLVLKQTQLQNQQALQKTQVQRQQLIQAINQHIQTKHEKLVALLHNKQQLEKTIELLNQQTSQPVFSQSSHVPNLPFGQLHGKLSWPTHGSIRDAFGTQVYQSELKWDGTLIAASQGQPIHAVAAGRVIFAKWMAGYGLLLIINQGNGYMTLYGRAQTLTKTVGDYVKANEVIGTVGKSGGFEHPALYFSIRHDGTAVNPARWCA
ncbi:MAG TPA: peptidoglycan DD-metalloendopeptidase family protein [Coxiellaceae bacterium]|nr:MAG: hypothetical protein A3E81_00660 [Gammaproteobacteria bacterium RIFCSPHIGHO2_12_FULL_36_30]HLB56670.1 peptidoglycan DD-metalloendopeptidase family protein [Coxiellaceae bacterium]